MASLIFLSFFIILLSLSTSLDLVCDSDFVKTKLAFWKVLNQDVLLVLLKQNPNSNNEKKHQKQKKPKPQQANKTTKKPKP